MDTAFKDNLEKKDIDFEELSDRQKLQTMKEWEDEIKRPFNSGDVERPHRINVPRWKKAKESFRIIRGIIKGKPVDKPVARDEDEETFEGYSHFPFSLLFIYCFLLTQHIAKILKQFLKLSVPNSLS